ncbi:Beta-galactosidase [Pararobbsia alpina]
MSDLRLGVCYYPEHWDESMWAEDARRMRELGIRQVRIAEFAWSRIEPSPGQYAWGWLDRAVEAIAAAGLEVVMCTPTATPPKWLIDAHPGILAVGADGRTRAFGSRRHYDFSSPEYFKAAGEIARQVAQRYGKHPAVTSWQIDNEFGCHLTVLSYSKHAVTRFREWLAQRYGSVEALNQAWGTVFWSMEYRSFDEIDAPIGTVTEALPAHRLDYRRFASDEVVRFNRMQVEIVRAHSPGRQVVHNFMQLFSEFDHYKVAADLDAATWDSYPLGGLEEAWFDADTKARWLRTGHPDYASFNHDLYRGMSKNPFWVMEQQPGPVNWAHWNPAPLPGMVRTWSWEAFAHGAGTVSYFRWRQVPFAQEQMHAGLNTPDNRLDIGGAEARQVAEEIGKLPESVAQPRSTVALVFDYASKWLFDIHPQGIDFNYMRFAFEYYSALRSLGLDVDIISKDAPLDGYRLIVVPSLAVVDDAFVSRIAKSGAQVVFGPRTGSKTDSLAIPANLPVGPLASLLPLRVWRVESMRPNATLPIDYHGRGGTARHWREFIDLPADASVLSSYPDGGAAVLRHRNCVYLASIFDDQTTRAILRDAATAAGVPTEMLEEGVRVSRRAGLTFVFNYGETTYALPAGATVVFGDAQVAPRQVTVFRAANGDAAHVRDARAALAS